jgi:hypothetical protein
VAQALETEKGTAKEMEMAPGLGRERLRKEAQAVPVEPLP